MNETRKLLVLQFSALAGLARTVMHEYVQNKLFKLGYEWGSFGHKTMATEMDALFICVQGPEFGQITFCSSANDTKTELASADYEHELFSVTHGLVDFLTKAETLRTKHIVLRDVDVTITPTNVEYDVTRLVAAVTQQAREYQIQFFGKRD